MIYTIFMNIYLGDCRKVMCTLDADSIDSIVTDPPYGLSFMEKGWDHGVPGTEFWTEALRIAKPGAHLLAFGGTRTFHRLAVAIEDAGWEIRDCVMWVYGNGFPKSHNLKNEWSGWGTALKPAWEPIIVARKPLDGTVAENVLKYGTGAINIDGCRVGTDTVVKNGVDKFPNLYGKYNTAVQSEHVGRWPANLIHDGGDEVTDLLGSAARFFYCAKTSKRDRDEGLDNFDGKQYSHDGRDKRIENAYQRNDSVARNHHPTVKPTSLMRYLCKLVTKPGGTVLDPFMGSGSTGKAAVLEGFNFIGIEQDAEYIKIAEARIKFADKEISKKLF